jgi:hypothetical protein
MYPVRFSNLMLRICAMLTMSPCLAVLSPV